MNTQQLVQTITELQESGKEVKLIVLPSGVKKNRKMMLRGQRTTA